MEQIEVAPVAHQTAPTIAESTKSQPVQDGSPGSPNLEVHDTPQPTRSKARIFLILTSLCLVLFVAALDQTVVATAVPTISSDLRSATGYAWIGGAYVLAKAAAGPVWAKGSDIWGRRLALLCAVVVFAAASVLAALSVSMAMLIASRALQGAAGGGLMQLVTITISDLFSLRRRSLFIALLGVIWAVAGSAGPPMGGALTELASWRWCFWINVPVCALSFACLFFFLDVHNPRTRFSDGVKALDWLGTLSLLAVTVLILLGLDFGGAVFPWSSPKVICLIAVGAAMIGFFIYSETRLARYPLLPLGIFTNWSNNAVLLITFSHNMVSIGIEYYLPLFFQSAKQFSPLQSGLFMLPMMVTEAAADIVAGVLMHRTGRYREIIWWGSVVMTLGTGLYVYYRPSTPLGTIVAIEIVWAVGNAALFQAPMIALQNAVSQADTASATASFGFVGNIATSVSIVIGGVVFKNSMDSRQPLLAELGLGEAVLEALAGDQAAANVEVVATIADAGQRQAVEDAYAWSLRNMFIMYTCIASLAIVGSAFIRHRTLSSEHTETKTGIENLSRREGSKK